MNNVENLCKNLCVKLLKSAGEIRWKSLVLCRIIIVLRKRVSFAEVFGFFSTRIYIGEIGFLSLKHCGFYTVSTVPNTTTNI